MANKVHVKRDDTVLILSGKDRGKQGKVLAVFPKKNRVVVEGVNVVTKHKKPRSATQQGGIIHQEAAIDSSNVMLICKRCNKATRVARKVLESGEKVRVCKKCNETIDTIKKTKKA